MRAILLAAGMGERLRPHTEERPKCMVKLWGKEIIARQIETFRKNGIEDLAVVGGYKAEELRKFLSDFGEITFYENRDYDKTNMTWSLFCARNIFEKVPDDDLIISYTDILFNSAILHSLINAKEDFSVAVDKQWRTLWELRQEDPIHDAETMKIDSRGYITELGKKPESLAEIEGQYMGLFKWNRSFAREAFVHYKSMDKEKSYAGKDFANMYMTGFLQELIDHLQKAKAVSVNGGWLEIDTVDDLALYESEKFSSFKKDILI